VLAAEGPAVASAHELLLLPELSNELSLHQSPTVLAGPALARVRFQSSVEGARCAGYRFARAANTGHSQRLPLREAVLDVVVETGSVEVVVQAS
jgi:hypothetical protein